MNYRDAEGHIRPELLDQEARETAQTLSRERRPELTSSQLRRFYNEFRRLKVKFDNDQEKNFKKILPLIKMQKSKTAYASNPKKPKIPKSFHDFITKHVDNINAGQDFEAFMLHFEAVIGFLYHEGMSNN